MKLIIQLFKYFKSLFKKIKIFKKQIKVNEKIIDEESTKKVEEKNKEFNKINLKNIKFGDIVFAKRYTNEEEMLKIPEGHREGPYIVILNNKNKLICCKGTGTHPRDEYFDRYFHLSSKKYKLYKDTYFYLKKIRIVDETNFIKKIDKLNKDDEIDFINKIKNIYSSKYNLENENINLNLLFSQGDIVLCNNKYYLIIDSINNKLISILLENINLNDELKFEKFKNLDYSTVVNLENENIKYINKVNNNIILYVLKKYKEYLETVKNYKNTQRGSIILKENKYYYIYSEEGENWVTFEISINNKQKSYQIKINNIKYFTNFNEIKINKKDKFDTICLCTQDEIDNLTSIRKKYKQMQKKKEEYEATKNLRLNVGDIIEIKYKKNMRFIIISVYSNTYECLSINDIKKAIYAPISVKKEDTKLSNDTSIKGIKWLEWNNSFKLSNIGKGKIIDMIFDTQEQYLAQINNKYKSNKKGVKRGNVILKENKYYYIYGEEANEWLSFEIKKEALEKHQTLKIEDNTFYTIYDDIKINKNDDFSIAYVCCEQEIDTIKYQRKKYKRDKQKKELSDFKKLYDKNILNDIQVGDLVKFDEFSYEEFIVENIIGDVLVCINNIFKGTPREVKHYIDKNSAVLISSKQKRK